MNPRYTTGQRIFRLFIMTSVVVIGTIVLIALLSTYA